MACWTMWRSAPARELPNAMPRCRWPSDSSRAVALAPTKPIHLRVRRWSAQDQGCPACRPEPEPTRRFGDRWTHHSACVVSGESGDPRTDQGSVRLVQGDRWLATDQVARTPPWYVCAPTQTIGHDSASDTFGPRPDENLSDRRSENPCPARHRHGPLRIGARRAGRSVRQRQIDAPQHSRRTRRSDIGASVLSRRTASDRRRRDHELPPRPRRLRISVLQLDREPHGRRERRIGHRNCARSARSTRRAGARWTRRTMRCISGTAVGR